MYDEYDDEGPPQEEPDDRPPLDLDEVEALYRKVHASVTTDEVATISLVRLVPELIDELRSARAEIERLNGLDTEEDFAVAIGGNQHPGDCEQLLFAGSFAAAYRLARGHNGGRPVGPAAVYVQVKKIHPWVRLFIEPLF